MSDTKSILRKPYMRVIVPEEDGSFFGTILEFPGCFAAGDTAIETLTMLEEVAESWLLSTIALGQLVPEPLNVTVVQRRFKHELRAA